MQHVSMYVHTFQKKNYTSIVLKKYSYVKTIITEEYVACFGEPCYKIQSNYILQQTPLDNLGPPDIPVDKHKVSLQVTCHYNGLKINQRNGAIWRAMPFYFVFHVASETYRVSFRIY